MVDPQMTQDVLAGVRDGDDAAAEQIWEEYFTKLVHVARRRLGTMPRRAVDEEDVALSAMYSFCKGMKAGRFDALDNRNDLWRLLITITKRKAKDHCRKQEAEKRGGGNVRGESIFVPVDGGGDRVPGIGGVAGDEPTPEMACMAIDSVHEMLDGLKEDQLREIALLRLEGYSTQEIARRLDCTQRAVQRKLERIRSKWGDKVQA